MGGAGAAAAYRRLPGGADRHARPHRRQDRLHQGPHARGLGPPEQEGLVQAEEQAEEKFNAWLQEKDAKIEAKKAGLSKAEADAKAKALEAEKKINEERAAAAAAAENEAIKAEADAKAAAAAEEAGEVVEEGPETIDDAQAAAQEEGKTE